MQNILVIGSINIDYIVSVENMPKLGETIKGKNFTLKYGGKGANQAFSSAKLGANVKLIASVGNDAIGKEVTEYLKLQNINVDNVKISDTNTGMAFINIDKNSENTIVLAEGANKELSSDYVLNKLENMNCDCIVLQNEIPKKTVENVILKAKELNIKSILNFAPARDMNFEVLRKVDILVVNETELNYIAKKILNIDEDNYELIIEKLIKEYNMNNILLTMGSKGCMYFNKENKYLKEAIKVDAIDTVGAGDTHLGAFVRKYDFNKNNIEESLEYANMVSAIAVTHSGAQVKEIEKYKF